MPATLYPNRAWFVYRTFGLSHAECNPHSQAISGGRGVANRARIGLVKNKSAVPKGTRIVMCKIRSPLRLWSIPSCFTWDLILQSLQYNR